MKTKILHLLTNVFCEHLGKNDIAPIDYDFMECKYDNWPAWDENKLGKLEDIYNPAYLIYPEYCMLWIEKEMGGMLESLQKDRAIKKPITLELLENYNAHLHLEIDTVWPKAVNEASMIVYRELYEYALEDGRWVKLGTSFENFLSAFTPPKLP